MNNLRWKILFGVFLAMAVLEGLFLWQQVRYTKRLESALWAGKAAVDVGTKKALDTCMATVAALQQESTIGTVLTESEPVAKPMSVLGGLLTIEPSFAGERAVPVWGVSCKGEARLFGSARPNHVYYWIDTKTRKIEGPFAPVVQPQ